jgi:trehalose 6-phosphate synthase
MAVVRPEIQTYPPLANTLREALGNRRLIVASNRGPLEYYTDDKLLRARRGSGGVVTALAGIADQTRLTWVASAMTDADRAMARLSPKLGEADASNLQVRFVTTPADTYHSYYNVVSNPTLWFLQHQMNNLLEDGPTNDDLRRAWLAGYVPVNKAFSTIIAHEAIPLPPSPLIMLHDYHLYMVPRFLREQIPDAFLHHFIHIPWPEPNCWQLFPASMRTDILASLCANDIVGFQTPRSYDRFLATCREYLPSAVVNYASGEITYNNHICRPRVYPISIDCRRVISSARTTTANHHFQNLSAPASMRTIVRVDRMDPTKNIVIGYQAFAHMLETHPELIGNVRFLSFLIPCRNGITAYQLYTDEVFRLIDEINQQYGHPGYLPIECFYQNDYEHALAGMRLYDVLLVNPVQDGMNLVAKEGPLVNERDGVVVLSREAGAYCELAKGVIPVWPLYVNDTSQQLYRGLMLAESERREMAAILRHIIQNNDMDTWLLKQFEDIRSFHTANLKVGVKHNAQIVDPINRISVLPRIVPASLSQHINPKTPDHPHRLPA